MAVSAVRIAVISFVRFLDWLAPVFSALLYEKIAVPFWKRSARHASPSCSSPQLSIYLVSLNPTLVEFFWGRFSLNVWCDPWFSGVSERSTLRAKCWAGWDKWISGRVSSLAYAVEGDQSRDPVMLCSGWDGSSIFHVRGGGALLEVIIQGALSQRIPCAIDCLFLPRGNMRLSILATKSVIVSRLFSCLLILLFGLSGLGSLLIL